MHCLLNILQHGTFLCKTFLRINVPKSILCKTQCDNASFFRPILQVELCIMIFDKYFMLNKEISLPVSMYCHNLHSCLKAIEKFEWHYIGLWRSVSLCCIHSKGTMIDNLK